MMSRFSPPPSPHKPTSRNRTRLALPRRRRLLYILAALAAFFLWLAGYSPLHALPHRGPKHTPSFRFKNVNWSHYAYFQYATDTAHLCNSVMIFESLDRLGSIAARVLVYPRKWDTRIEGTSDRISQLLVKARDWYNVKLIPTDIPVTPEDADNVDERAVGFHRFLAWGGESYKRILYLDSDTTIRKHVDELFLLPETSVVMMRDYTLLPSEKVLSSRLIVLQPSPEESERLTTAVRADILRYEDDVDILNRFYGDSAMVLPHQAYGLRTSEFRSEDHTRYIGNTYESWDPEQALREASLVHFEDDPFPKPWVMWSHV
ncbi:MAG: hypothetical protein Q9174_006942, partial [Haloplaca sp. 1 TL-2023]